jgi:hypothetical protein
MNVFDEEGVRYETSKLKIMGVEAVKSSTPEVCRGKIKDAIRVIMNEDEDAFKFIPVSFKEVFKTLKSLNKSFLNFEVKNFNIVCKPEISFRLYNSELIIKIGFFVVKIS